MHVADAALAEVRSAGRGGYRGCVVGGDVSTLAQERGCADRGTRCPPRMNEVLVLGAQKPERALVSLICDSYTIFYTLQLATGEQK